MAKQTTFWLFRVGLLLCAAAFFATGAWLHRPSVAAAPAAPAEARPPQAGSPPVPVEVARASLGEVQRRVRTQGLLEPCRSVSLAAEVHGGVVERDAQELEQVDAGQLLLRVDPVPFRSAVRRAEAAVLRSESALELAAATLRRRRALVERGVQSPAALEDAQNAERAAHATLRQARADLREARHHLERTEIRAPFAGFLKQLSSEPGEFVHEGQVVAEVMDLSVLEVQIGLSDREVVGVRAGKALQVEFADVGVAARTGTIVRVGLAAATDTRKFPVRLEIDNADGSLLPGMVASVELDVAHTRHAVVIPASAVLEDERGSYVYALSHLPSASPVARRRQVSVRPTAVQPDLVEVVFGIRAGEELVVRPAPRVADGVRVVAAGSRA